MRLPLHEFILALIESLALGLLIMRLLLSGLVRIYKYFCCYLIVDLLETTLPFYSRPLADLLNFRSMNDLYGYLYIAYQALKLCCYVLIIFELYSILLRDLKGIAKLAQRYTSVALGISILLSLLLSTALPRPGNVIEQLFYVEIPIIASLVLFMLLLTVFLAYYPVPLHRNALLYAIGYAVFFFAKAALLFLANLHASELFRRACSTAVLILDLSCIVLWTVFLNRDGELRNAAIGHSWGRPERQQHVLERLRELNESLLRAGPK